MESPSTSVTYSDIPQGYTVKSSPQGSYSDVPEGYSVKAPKDTSIVPTDKVRSAYRGVADTLYQGINDVGGAIGKAVSSVVPDRVEKYVSEGVENSALGKAGSLLGKVADTEINDLSQYNQDLKPDLKALGKNVKAAANIPIVKPVAELAASKGLGGLREAVNAKSDTMAKKVPLDKENAYILKVLKKEGHSDKDIVEIMNRVKDQGMTVGEASGNPKLLGIERKISGLNQPGGTIIRDFIKDRVDPNNNVSMPYKLKDIADPLVKEVDKASKEIGNIIATSPKTPVSMTSVESSLAKEARPPKSMVTNTLNRIDGLVDWAKMQGGSFADWHRVKQELWNMKSEAKDPTAVEKLDSKTINNYYKKVNDILSGKAPGLPEDLRQTGSKYAAANTTFQKNLSGRTIQDVLNKMPTGGTPASALKFLYKQLAGDKELQEELFAGMPEKNREGMMKLLEAIKDSSRSGANDVVKSMEDGSPTFPFSKASALHKMYNAIADALTRKDYDALGKALTSPNTEAIAKKLGYVKKAEPQKPILRLTYQPEQPEMIAGTGTAPKIATAEEQAANNATRDRMQKLGITPGVLRAQNMHVIRAMETKYGASNLGKFMIEHMNEPIMSKMWEIPDTEYSQAQINKMLNNSKYNTLKKAEKEQINSELKRGWESQQVVIADLVLAAKQAAEDLAKAKGETSIMVRNPFGKNPLSNTFDDMLKNQ